MRRLISIFTATLIVGSIQAQASDLQDVLTPGSSVKLQLSLSIKPNTAAALVVSGAQVDDVDPYEGLHCLVSLHYRSPNEDQYRVLPPRDLIINLADSSAVHLATSLSCMGEGCGPQQQEDVIRLSVTGDPSVQDIYCQNMFKDRSFIPRDKPMTSSEIQKMLNLVGITLNVADVNPIHI